MSGKIVYQCRLCEKVHQGLPAIAYDAPAHYHDLAEPERATRAILSDDLCGIEGAGHFVRAVLEIPVIAHEECLEWGVGAA